MAAAAATETAVAARLAFHADAAVGTFAAAAAGCSGISAAASTRRYLAASMALESSRSAAAGRPSIDDLSYYSKLVGYRERLARTDARTNESRGSSTGIMGVAHLLMIVSIVTLDYEAR